MSEPLILIPGLGCNEEVWDFQKKYLDAEVICCDNQDSLEEMTAHVLKNAPEKFTLAGHSMGGWIAQSVAATAPHRISKLILTNTWARSHPNFIAQLKAAKQCIEEGKTEDALEAHIKEAVYPPRLNEEELLNRLRYLQRRQPAEVYLRQINAILANPEIISLLKKITAPTLVIHSRQDALFSLEELEIVAQTIKNASFTIIEECGHATPIERPHALTALINVFSINKTVPIKFS